MAPAYPHSPTFLGPESPTGVPTPCEYCHQQGVHFGFLLDYQDVLEGVEKVAGGGGAVTREGDGREERLDKGETVDR